MRFDPVRPTRAVVDLDALAHNLRVLRGPLGCQLWGVVKADAYGHGLVPVARRLEAEGVEGLCVALVEEGLTLRAAGVTVPILVLNAAYGDQHAAVLQAELTPVIWTPDHVERFLAAAPPERPVAVHLKVDTGMGRLGVPLAELPALLEHLARHPRLHVAGLMTHLSSADSDAAATHGQLRGFEQAITQVRARGHRPALVHAANSAGALCFPASHHSMVRVGLSLYGVPPVPGQGPDLWPVMRWETAIVSLRRLPAGAPVGYDRTFHTRRESVIATVPLGYADGLHVAASNRASMLVGGVPCAVVGRVSMDLTTVDVTAVPGVAVGDGVVVLGEQGEQALTAHDLARASGTIAYEVLTSVSARVPRVYRP